MVATEDRPLDETPVATADLPATPQRDRAIPATAWREAPDALLALAPVARYLRRIGPWLLWRSGAATHEHATYFAVRADDVAVRHTFHLRPDGSGDGTGPSGERHSRFRTWKEDLRDHAEP